VVKTIAARRTSRRRVLVIAEAANPEWVSVPLVGWSIATALRGVADVHLVTQVRNKAAIERAGLVEGRDFTSIDTEALMKPLWALIKFLGGGAGKGWTIVTAIQSLSYPLFERMVWKHFGKRIKAGEFDVVHRVTPLSPTAPSLLAGRCARADVPFVLGPLNGGVPWPEGFNEERHKEREWLSYIRSIYKLMPGICSTWRNASAIVAASMHTRSELPAAAQAKSIYIPENAVDPKRFSAPSEQGRYDRLHLCFIGRLVPYKGADIALEAARHLLLDGRGRLTIIGDGPMMPALREQAASLGISDAVEFTGWLDHRKIPAIASRSSVFLFPSVREFGGGAVIEAMALGLVPIVVNYGGPGEIVTDDTGFRLPMGQRRSLIANASMLLGELAEGRHDIGRMAANGLERVHSLYTWEKKALQLNEVYDWVCGERPDRPHFPFLEVPSEAGHMNAARTGDL
jgi:glycosyltransferase involved in cell wall biosynthesis